MQGRFAPASRVHEESGDDNDDEIGVRVRLEKTLGRSM